MQPRVQRILLMRPARVLRSGLALKPSTLFHFHKLLTKQKYRLLFSARRVRRPGPKGPTKELIDAVVENEMAQIAPGAASGLPSRSVFRCESAILRTYWVLVVISIYTTDCRLCRSPRRCGWNGIVPDVQSLDSRTDTAELSQFGS